MYDRTTSIVDCILSIIINLLERLQSIFHWISHGGGTKKHSDKKSGGIKDDMTGSRLTFQNNNKEEIRIRIGKRIAEGGFSYVYEAFDISSKRRKEKYALKRINCSDADQIRQCRHEADIHSKFNHENLLGLSGMTFRNDDDDAGSGSSSSMCFMLFPYLSHSLRGDIHSRNLLSSSNTKMTTVRPYTTREIWSIFQGIGLALQEMHRCNYSHRDVKIENVMLSSSGKPILMDFGSVGPKTTSPLRTRLDVLKVVDQASVHTTMTYRAPELFDGGLRHVPLCHEEEEEEDASEAVLDYGKCDVWSLGCILFGLMYGTSPFELEFRRNHSHHHQAAAGGDGDTTTTSVKIVDCSHLKILGPIPRPPDGDESELGRRYKGEVDLDEMVSWILNQDRMCRPDVGDVLERLDRIQNKDQQDTGNNKVSFDLEKKKTSTRAIAVGGRRRGGGGGGGGWNKKKQQQNRQRKDKFSDDDDFQEEDEDDEEADWLV